MCFHGREWSLVWQGRRRLIKTQDRRMNKDSEQFKIMHNNRELASRNAMIKGLIQSGDLPSAKMLFDEMPEKDIVSWTTMISGYIKHGLIEKARRLFDRVDALKNVVTWTAMVSGYVKANQMLEAERVFKVMPTKNVISWNTMMDGFVRNNQIDNAIELFDKMPERNAFSWNKMLIALMHCGRVEEACKLFNNMPTRDVISWTAMIDGLAKNKNIDEAKEVFDAMPKRNVVSWNAMINGYAKCRRLDDALKMFEKMPTRNSSSWNAIIMLFIQNTDLLNARMMFDKMPEKDVISWTTMITGYVLERESEEAMKLFLKMIRNGRVNPNEVTLINLLHACSDIGGHIEGQQVHQVLCKRIHCERPFVVSGLINMYSACGDLGAARKIFDGGAIQGQDVVTWNTLITAYAHHGCGREAIELFNKMKDLRLKPNDVSYVGMLSACSHAGLVNEGLEYFNDLVEDESVCVRDVHYTRLVDLCGRAGRLMEAYSLITKQSSKPSSSSWGALLSWCHIHGDSELGMVVAERLLSDDPENAVAYLLLSNIHASCGRRKKALMVRLEMKNKGLKKQPGCSWIEVEKHIRVFVASDRSHFESNSLLDLLHVLHLEAKKACDMANNDYTVSFSFSSI